MKGKGCYLCFWSSCSYWTPHESSVNQQTLLFQPIRHPKFTIAIACLHFLTLTCGSIPWNWKVHLAVFLQKTKSTQSPWLEHNPRCSTEDTISDFVCFLIFVWFVFRIYSTEIVKAVCVLLFSFDFYTNTWKWVSSGKYWKLWKCTTLGKQTQKKINI